MIEIIQDHEFNKLDNIGHAFFTRKGGVSTGHLHGLNCSDTSSDNPEHVAENRRIAMAYLNFPLESLVMADNVHGNQVAVVDSQWFQQPRPQADAIITQLNNVVLTSDSADCPIILFADEQAQIIGLAHAGWKGAKLGVIENTIAQMISLGANHHNISAVVSPCIRQCSYEVSEDFYQHFLLEDVHYCIYFLHSKNVGHYMFDLLRFVKDKLIKLHLKSVSCIGLDTYIYEDLFFSCRRAYHQGFADFGGHLSGIYLQNGGFPE